MRNETKHALTAALQSVRDGARESRDVTVENHAYGCHSVCYLRTGRGIVRIAIGPDGQHFSERLVERA